MKKTNDVCRLTLCPEALLNVLILQGFAHQIFQIFCIDVLVLLTLHWLAHMRVKSEVTQVRFLGRLLDWAELRLWLQGRSQDVL